MKILLVCAGGMSTGLLMKKMEAYWEDQGVDLEIMAAGTSEYDELCQDYDIILVGPQIAYRLEEIRNTSGLPTEAIPSFDYAVANCPNIMKLANKLYSQK